MVIGLSHCSADASVGSDRPRKGRRLLAWGCLLFCAGLGGEARAEVTDPVPERRAAPTPPSAAEAESKAEAPKEQAPEEQAPEEQAPEEQAPEAPEEQAPEEQAPKEQAPKEQAKAATKEVLPVAAAAKDAPVPVDDVAPSLAEPPPKGVRAAPPPQMLEVLPGAMARTIGRVEGRGVWLGTPDRQFIFRFSGFVHLDYRLPVDLNLDEGIGARALQMVRRARFAAEGTVFGNIDYRVMADPAVELFPLDAFMDWRFLPELNFRAGRFKSPFGFERRARAFALPFNERGFPTLIAPNRDTGGFVHGQTVDGFFSYDVALLAGAGDSESVIFFRGSPDAAGRVYFQPFRLVAGLPLLREFGVGLSGTWGYEHGNKDDARLGRMQTTGRTLFFRYLNEGDTGAATFADGARRRASVHGHWRYKRVNTMWEYIWSEQVMSHGNQTAPIANQAWQAYVGAALTEDEWGFFGIVPRRPFSPSRGAYGAAAIAARYHGVRIDPAAFPRFADPAVSSRGAHAGSLSFQWVLSQNLGAQFDTEVVRFEGGLPGNHDRPLELSAAVRLQSFY
jgi:phosphate-selective porin OprO and OprP